MADEEPKQDVKPQVETIQISLQGSNGEQTHFKVKPTTKMGKIFDAYSKRQGVPTSTFRVILDGDRVNADDTPQSVRALRRERAGPLRQRRGVGALLPPFWRSTHRAGGSAQLGLENGDVLDVAVQQTGGSA